MDDHPVGALHLDSRASFEVEAGVRTKDSNLDVQLRIGVEEDFRISVLEISSPFLPWLQQDSIVCDGLHKRIGASLNELLPKDSPSNWNQPDQVREKIADDIADLLATYEIFVTPEVSCVLEEHSDNLLGNLPFFAAEWLKPVAYKEYILQQCDVLNSNSIRFQKADLFFSPDAGQCRKTLTFQTDVDFGVSEIRIYINGNLASHQQRSRVVRKGFASFDLPDIPVRCYRDLIAANCEIKVEMILGNRKPFELPSPLRCGVADITGSQVALLVDMGSTYSKMFEVDLSGPQYDQYHANSSWEKALEDILGKVSLDNTLCSRFQVEGPLATPTFIESYGLPDYRKRQIDVSDEGEIENAIAAAIHSFAGSFAKRGRAIAAVIWSFPNTSGRDFDKLTNKVSGLVSSSVLGNVRVVPEHLALKNRFKKSLHRLAALAEDKQRAASTAEKHNKKVAHQKRKAKRVWKQKKQNFDKSWWIVKLFTREPIAPHDEEFVFYDIPKIEDWHRKFLDISTDPELNDVFILDAGGYSLDMFGQIGDRTLGKSFAAGGQTLTRHTRTHLASEGKVSEDDISLNEAEDFKREACRNDDQSRSRPLAKLCREWTHQIYDIPVGTAVDWLKCNLNGRGIPLIITGGGMANDYLRELIREKLASAAVSITSTDSVEISELISNEESNDALLKRFGLITSGFRPESLHLTLAYDIVGGLCET
jgi:hypothetical protein